MNYDFRPNSRWRPGRRFQVFWMFSSLELSDLLTDWGERRRPTAQDQSWSRRQRIVCRMVSWQGSFFLSLCIFLYILAKKLLVPTLFSFIVIMKWVLFTLDTFIYIYLHIIILITYRQPVFDHTDSDRKRKEGEAVTWSPSVNVELLVHEFSTGLNVNVHCYSSPRVWFRGFGFASPKVRYSEGPLFRSLCAEACV